MRFFKPKKAALLGMVAILAICSAAAEEPSPWLGVYLVDEVDGGIRIVAVVPGGPASVAGLRMGDLLIEAGSVQLVDQAVLERVLEGRGWDNELQLAVLRDGESRVFRVKPSARLRTSLLPAPPTVAMPPTATLGSMTWSSPGLTGGLKTVPITAELRAHYGVPEDRGVLVVRVDDEGPIGRAGIEVGDVLVGVAKKPVSSPAEVSLALVRHDRSVPLSIEVVRKRETVVMELAPVAPVARAVATPAVGMLYTSEARATQIERSIALLERQLETLRKQLAEIKTAPEAPKADKPASPDR